MESLGPEMGKIEYFKEIEEIGIFSKELNKFIEKKTLTDKLLVNPLLNLNRKELRKKTYMLSSSA